MMVGSSVTLLIPVLLQMYTSLLVNDFDGVLECQPPLFTTAINALKLVNLQINRKRVRIFPIMRKMFISVEEEWNVLEFDSSLYVLDDITKTGSKIAHLYRSSILSLLVAFVFLPLANPMLDIVMPLNVTRPRPQVFKLYYFVNNDEHFLPIYFHASICSICVILMMITVDSVYMVLAHHNCGLFAVCGDKIKKLTQNNRTRIGVATRDDGYEEVRECVVVHKKAIEFVAIYTKLGKRSTNYLLYSTHWLFYRVSRFFKILEQMTRSNYVGLIGAAMICTCVTAFQVVVHLNEPFEALRHCVFCIGNNFHLFYVSIPGQIIADHSFELSTNMYSSEWYQTSVRVQRVLGMVQLRSSRPCELTAGGVYRVNIENFGVSFKTCMSYFTMLLSTRK
ncbi:uncharacterized protein LOC128886784 [Hylaeus anthracinus]|uniref:uncharacterized protein LOC128886784 n=1 Tax=Hylaeus anthracinus TaxID=313031 RepID=UPI0023B926AE|nr:uncharacterized protein LOC128886784 [Hylaeus anthracinus]